MPPIEMPHDVRGVEPEVVEQAEAVVGHVVERVRRRGRRARRRRSVRTRIRRVTRPRRDPGGAAGVAVVVADHVEARGRPAAGRSPGPTRSSARRAPSPAAAARRRGRRRSGSRSRRRPASGANCSGEAPAGTCAAAGGRGWTSGPPRRASRCYRPVYRLAVRRTRPVGTKVTVRRASAYFRYQVVTVTLWSRHWGRSCARRGSPGPSGLRAIAREGSAVGEAARFVRRSAHDRLHRRDVPYASAGPRARPRAGRPGPRLHGRRRHPGADVAAPARPGLPHLPLHDARQRRLHPRGLRGARAAHRGDRAQARPQGDHRRAQPRRPDGPRPRRSPPGPRRRHRHARQPDPGAGRGPPDPAVRPHAAHPAAAGRPRPDDGGGLHLRRRARGRAGSSPGSRWHRGCAFTSVFSRRDGIVDWRSCLDPQAKTVEVRTSHLGMAFDPVVLDVVAEALAANRARRAREVSRQARLAAVPDASAG